MWSEDSSQLNAKMQVLDMRFLPTADAAWYCYLTNVWDTKPQYIYLPSEHTEHPESFMDWSDWLKYQLIWKSLKAYNWG